MDISSAFNVAELIDTPTLDICLLNILLEQIHQHWMFLQG